MNATTERVTERLDPETLTFILDWTKDAPERQVRDGEASDTKMVQILGAASIVIGLTGIANRTASSAPSWVMFGLLVALAIYAALACIAVAQLWPKRFQRSAQADELFPNYWADDVQTVRHALAHNVSEAYRFNKAVLAQKKERVCWALGLLALQVVVVGVTVISAASAA